MVKQKLKREGFYDSENKPQITKGIWYGRKEFIKALRLAQGKARKELYKRVDHCMFCDCINCGVVVYEYKGWVWPDSYEHYVTNHNVQPSIKFANFLIRLMRDTVTGTGVGVSLSDNLSFLSHLKKKVKALATKQEILQDLINEITDLPDVKKHLLEKKAVNHTRP